jgi:hypothetical protein
MLSPQASEVDSSPRLTERAISGTGVAEHFEGCESLRLLPSIFAQPSLGQEDNEQI